MSSEIAIVKGGSRGLGKDMDLSLARKGINVIRTYHSKRDEALNVVDEILSMKQKALSMQMDVRDLNSFDSFFAKRFLNLKKNWESEKVYYLTNNAGIRSTLPIQQVAEEVFDHLLNLLFKRVYFLTQKSLPLINDIGGVIFISTGTTRFCAPGYSVYVSRKGALEIFTKHLARENGNRGIRVNIAAPGAIATDFNGAAIRNNPQMKAFNANQIALGMVGQADEVGSAVAFLCKDEAKWTKN